MEFLLGLLASLSALAPLDTPLPPTSEEQHGVHQEPQHQHQPLQHQPGQHDHSGHIQGMPGMLGRWSMNREGSGTSWIPESSPMYMKMYPRTGAYSLGLMGVQTLNYTDQGGLRGEEQLFSNSMWMLMAHRNTGGGILGYRLMVSTDPLINGKEGYPLLFQTGETANGQALQDRQHPHDLISELAASWSQPISDRSDAFVYTGIVGEPVLGNAMYLHRPSGWDNPEAPVSHHWFDSTHIAFGVVTAGVTLDNKWKLEGSLFNGHEPDEDRYDIDPIQLNSAAGRLSYSPNRDWTFSVAYGFLDEPEALEPGINQNRITASAHYNQTYENGDNFAASALLGRNIKRGHHDPTNAFVLEGAYTRGDTVLFGRWEMVEKDELVGVPHATYDINKFSVGATREISRRDGFEYALGLQVSAYSFPGSLEPYYGRNPFSFGVFLRVRPERMRH